LPELQRAKVSSAEVLKAGFTVKEMQIAGQVLLSTSLMAVLPAFLLLHFSFSLFGRVAGFQLVNCVSMELECKICWRLSTRLKSHALMRLQC
jgi:hypothetical protein